MTRRSRTLLLLAAALATAPGLAAQARDTVPAGPLSLLDAIRLGREHAVGAVASRLSARIAESRIGQRRADLLPTLSGSAGFTRSTVNFDEFGFPPGLLQLPGGGSVVPAFNVYRFRLSVQQTLFDAAAFSRLRAARDTAVAAGLDAQAVGEIAGATAGLAYLRVLSAEETVRARLADSAVASSLLGQARELVSAGVSPAIDGTRSEVNLASVRTQLEVARNALDRARLDLLRTLDLPPATTLTLADSLGLGSLDLPREPADAEAYALAHRTELQAERVRLAAANRNLQALRFDQLPTLVTGGYVQETGQRTDNLAGTWALQFGLQIPLIDGFRGAARRTEQRQRIASQELRAHDAERQVATEARQAMLDLRSAEEQVRLSGERLRLAELELAQAEERFRSGVAGSIETTNAQGAVIAARDALIQARVSYGSARVTAYRALGAIDQLP